MQYCLRRVASRVFSKINRKIIQAWPLWLRALPPSAQKQAVADLGSDPNSAQQAEPGWWSHTELGSDPNSAGHHRRLALARTAQRFPIKTACSAYPESASRYSIDNASGLLPCHCGSEPDSVRQRWRTCGWAPNRDPNPKSLPSWWCANSRIQ